MVFHYGSHAQNVMSSARKTSRKAFPGHEYHRKNTNMPHTIYKYPFSIEDKFTKLLPVNAQILSVDWQRGIPTMWVLHNTNTNIVEERAFRIYGTGADIIDVEKLTFIGTFQMHNGDFIWHVFEEHNNGTRFIEDVLNESIQKQMEPDNA